MQYRFYIAPFRPLYRYVYFKLITCFAVSAICSYMKDKHASCLCYCQIFMEGFLCTLFIYMYVIHEVFHCANINLYIQSISQQLIPVNAGTHSTVWATLAMSSLVVAMALVTTSVALSIIIYHTKEEDKSLLSSQPTANRGQHLLMHE